MRGVQSNKYSRDQERDLLRRCEHALTTAARAAGTNTRQQVRAAARGFVRRHRRNGSYLAFVLRSVLANSALALALLGFASASAQARSTLFLENTGTANPMNGQDVGILSTPAATDIDHDGDLDIVSGERYGTFLYYTNIGSATAPSYIIQPSIIVDVGDASAPAFGDLDHDGTDDELVGTAAGTFAYFGSNIFALNPMNGVDVGSYATPAFGDLDADGDLDLVSGTFNGVVLYFENTGDAKVPQFEQQTGDANPIPVISVGLFAAPSLADLDGDGDLDLVVGTGYGTFVYFENTGSPLTPKFVVRTGADNPLAGIDVGGRSTPVLADFDADGDADVLAGETYGTFKFYANQAGHFVLRSGAANPLSAIDVGDDSAPAFGDLDADGDLDIVSGDFIGQFHYLKNIGTTIAAAFQEQTGTLNPLGFADVGTRSKPAIADIGFYTPDGKLDVSSGANDGTFHFYKNTGTASAPAFEEQTGSQTNPFYNEDVGANSAPALGDLDGFIPENVTGENFGTFLVSEPFSTFISVPPGLTGQDVGTYSTPSLGDTDGDGDLDLVAGEQSGVFNYYENIGDPLAPEFLLHSDAKNPVAGQDIGFDSAPALGDLDGDGARDLVTGQLDGQFSFFKNVLIRPWPRYAGPSPIPFRDADVGFFSTPASGDLDADGDPDFAASLGFGSEAISYFENTGDALLPSLVERTGAANPFNGLNAGTTPHLAFGDLDADGDLDLISGGYGYGDPTRYFENTGTATTPHFVERTGGANPVAGIAPGRTAPVLGDLDGDGDLDAVAGEFYGTLHFYENTGNADTAAFVERFGGANPLSGFDVGSFSAPALGDVDRDGDLDVVVGDEPNGVFAYFENTGTATAPAFMERTGNANPLNGEDVGLNCSPTFSDLDGDGDLDVVAGERYGQFRTYYLPEPSAPSLFAAGASLLAWLSRWRERRRHRGD
jgi:hypothetical protein